jgi:pimeloyl-ACP methyl ester carboxylesterase
VRALNLLKFFLCQTEQQKYARREHINMYIFDRSPHLETLTAMDFSAVLDHPLISKQVFFPRPSGVDPTLRVDVGGIELGCHLRRVDPKARTVVYFHGNGELAAECDRYFSGMFTDLGINICFAEYRGYGASGGTPALAGMLGDGVRIVEALGVPPERVIAFGRSLGSLYAVELVRRLPQIGGLVIESGIADVLDLWPLEKVSTSFGGTAAEITSAITACLDQRTKLTGYTGPFLVMHTAHDQLLEPSHAKRLHTWGGGSDKRLVIFSQGNHNTIFAANATEYLSEVRSFLRKIELAHERRGD